MFTSRELIIKIDRMSESKSFFSIFFLVYFVGQVDSYEQVIYALSYYITCLDGATHLVYISFSMILPTKLMITIDIKIL